MPAMTLGYLEMIGGTKLKFFCDLHVKSINNDSPNVSH